jgi:hypothetical protein
MERRVNVQAAHEYMVAVVWPRAYEGMSIDDVRRMALLLSIE